MVCMNFIYFCKSSETKYICQVYDKNKLLLIDLNFE